MQCLRSTAVSLLLTDELMASLSGAFLSKKIRVLVCGRPGGAAAATPPPRGDYAGRSCTNVTSAYTSSTVMHEARVSPVTGS